MSLSIGALFPQIPDVRIVDVGASDLGHARPYQSLIDGNRADIVGFEPDPDQLNKLRGANVPRATWLGDAVGDGKAGTLHICRLAGLNSLLEPDFDVLSHFHGFAEWAAIQRTVPLQTRRLDDVPEARGAHYLKLDVQGSELAVLQHSHEVLQSTLFVQLEVQFVPFYKNQPLFAELDLFLRSAGFWLHRFLPIHSRVFKPLLLKKDIYAGLSQQLWADAVYVRRFVDFPQRSAQELLQTALIAHELYQSYDLAALALFRLDQQDGGDRQPRYLQALVGGPPK